MTMKRHDDRRSECSGHCCACAVGRMRTGAPKKAWLLLRRRQRCWKRRQAKQHEFESDHSGSPLLRGRDSQEWVSPRSLPER